MNKWQFATIFLILISMLIGVLSSVAILNNLQLIFPERDSQPQIIIVFDERKGTEEILELQNRLLEINGVINVYYNLELQILNPELWFDLDSNTYEYIVNNNFVVKNNLEIDYVNPQSLVEIKQLFDDEINSYIETTSLTEDFPIEILVLEDNFIFFDEGELN